MNLSSAISYSYQYIPTLNRMGYMSPGLDEIQKGFVTYAQQRPSGLFLDIGCGFGIATLPVIQNNGRIIACDLEQKHLDVLKQGVPLHKTSLLTLISGHFPNEIVFPNNVFDGINFSMVLHFLPPQIIERALSEIFKSLKEGGKLFITTSSPYQGTLASFVPIYEKKLLDKDEWPGYINDIARYVPHRAHLLPQKNIVFCIHELRRLTSNAGFHVLKETFFSREGIPPDLRLDGREYSGLVCEKPKASSSVFLEYKSEIIPMQAANIR